MPTQTEIDNALNRLPQYNNGSNDSVGIPLGGGFHPGGFISALGDVATIGAATGDKYTLVVDLHSQTITLRDTAQTAATTATTQADRAQTEADRAQAQADRATAEADRAEAAAASVDGSTVPDPAPANAGLVARSNGAVVEWDHVRPVVVDSVTSNTTLEAGRAYRIVAPDAVTLTLPLFPAAGDSIRILDGESISETVAHTVDRNGKSIMGLAENLILDVAGIDVTIWYNGTEWRLF
ncbi:hypothetical protein [Caenispirillum bisanense]|uniref:Uncharacterized protein n=1 Tax=Caenispirillum bisanense TaxID=414052 RepID=A0A286GPK7_9PROT|nr:hypothetical protein [Caenispirillum bisanense]SOD97009.1 hypothetical protein SAMN05421508_106205 [Caenispirillum bisanense]